MTTDERKKTNDIANLRIHVEKAINRVKFLSNTERGYSCDNATTY